MTETEQLKQEIADLEAELAPKQQRLNDLYRAEAQAVDDRIKLADQGKGDFTLEELRFSAGAKCECGAGLAYPLGSGAWGSWHCSDILLGRALPQTEEGSKRHNSPLPFMLYSIASEDQMLDSQTRYRDKGMTTRPEA